MFNTINTVNTGKWPFLVLCFLELLRCFLQPTFCLLNRLSVPQSRVTHRRRQTSSRRSSSLPVSMPLPAYASFSMTNDFNHWTNTRAGQADRSPSQYPCTFPLTGWYKQATEGRVSSAMKLQFSSRTSLRKRMISVAENIKSNIPVKARQLLKKRGQAARPQSSLSNQNAAEGCQWKVKWFRLVLPSPKLVAISPSSPVLQSKSKTGLDQSRLEEDTAHTSPMVPGSVMISMALQPSDLRACELHVQASSRYSCYVPKTSKRYSAQTRHRRFAKGLGHRRAIFKIKWEIFWKSTRRSMIKRKLYDDVCIMLKLHQTEMSFKVRVPRRYRSRR
jgi:hypothetical protein